MLQKVNFPLGLSFIKPATGLSTDWVNQVGDGGPAEGAILYLHLAYQSNIRSATDSPRLSVADTV